MDNFDPGTAEALEEPLAVMLEHCLHRIEPDVPERRLVLPSGMKDTPRRIARAWWEMTRGYDLDPKVILQRDFDGEGYDEVIALSGISFTSLCEHHVMPFTGTAGVAYLPGDGRIVGLSKLARLVDCFALRFQVQERMTKQIADALEEGLHPRGVAVVVHGTHACMTARGTLKPGSIMTTSVMRGVFMDKPEARAEVLRLLAISDGHTTRGGVG